MANGDTAPPAALPMPTNPGVVQSLPPPRDTPAPQRVAQNFPPRVPQNYIPTNNQPWFGGRSMNELGTPTPDIEGLSGYPGWPNTSGFPQMRDIPSVIGGLVQNFGRFGPQGVANPMLQAGLGMQGITKDFIAGQLAQLKVNREMMENRLIGAQVKAEEILRDYQEVYHLYGPELDANGKTIKPGEPKKFHEALLNAAREHNDRYLQQALESGDYKAADRYLRWFDGNKQDLDKLNKLLRNRRIEQQIKEQDEKDKARSNAEAPFRAPSVPGATGGPSFSPNTGVPVPPDINSDKDTIPEDTGTTSPKTEDSSEPDTAPSERSNIEAAPGPSTAAAPSAVPVAPKAPQQLAQAAPVQGPAAARSPDLAAGVQPLPTSVQDRPLVMQAPAAPGTPPAPQGNVIVRDPSGVSIGPAGSRFVNNVNGYKPLPSDALRAAHAAGFTNDSLINQYAQAAVNREISIQDARQIPRAVVPYINARAMEMAREYDRIQQSNLSGEDIYKAINLFNPKFSGILRKYVSGDVPPPASAWQNPTYRDRVVGLGSKVDPGFTYHTFRTKSAALRDIAVGQSGRNHLALATAYSHGKALLEDLKHRPDFLPSLLGNVRGVADLVASPQEQEALGRLQNDVNTFNAEYERALTQGKPTVTAREEQSKELPIVTGNTRTMVANIFSKLQRLRDREEELEKQFQASTGQQPGTMLDFLKQGTEGELSALRDMQREMLPPPTSPKSTADPRVIDGKRYEKR